MDASPPATERHSLATAAASSGYGLGEPDLFHTARAAEYPALRDTVFLDHAAAPPAPLGPLTALTGAITSTLFSNPHSASTSGVATHLMIDQTRTRVLRDLFNITNDRVGEWDVVFVPGGATQAIRTLGDAWDWSSEADMAGEHGYEYLVESHTSLVGLRGTALSRNASVAAHPTPAALLRSVKRAAASSASRPSSSHRAPTPTLYSYPAQCNATGARLGLRFCAQIKRAHPHAAVLVDAAAYSSTNVLDLGSMRECEAPDFVVASVYKIFGFPTSLGILLVRRASAHLLLGSRTPHFFGGGTLSSLSLSAPFTHSPRLDPSGAVHQALEHGTPPYLEILALSHALDWLDTFTRGKGLRAVAAHTAALREVAVRELQALRHADGSQVLIEYAAFRSMVEEDHDSRMADEPSIVLEPPGPIVGFSLRLPRSSASSPQSLHHRDTYASKAPELADLRRSYVGHQHLARLALLEGIALRSGGMCNAGAWTRAVGMDEVERKRLESLGAGTCWDEDEFAPFAPFRPLGITRISFGLASTMEDVRAFLAFVKRFFVSTHDVLALEPAMHRNIEATQLDAPGNTLKRARLAELYIYPIKSCAAQPLQPSTPWQLTPTGLLYDREFMLVSASTGRALSMKRYTRMALIRPGIDLERAILRVEAVGMDPLEVPLAHSKTHEVGACGLPTPPISDDGHTPGDEHPGDGATAPRSTTLCGTTVLSQRFSAAADAWFTAFLNAADRPSLVDAGHWTTGGAGPGPVELHRLPPGTSRHAHSDGGGPPLPLRLSNESPYLLVSSESLRAVGSMVSARAADAVARAEEPGRQNGASAVRAATFRPNLVVEGAQEGALDPWWEDDLEALHIGCGPQRGGGGVFTFLGRCRRCLMVSVDQTTGARTAEPLATLSLTRKNAANGRVEFGAHMLWRDELANESPGGEGPCIRVGDEVLVRLRA